MDENILEWLLSWDNPEVRLRTLKEFQKLGDDNPKVMECKNKLLQSKVYELTASKSVPAFKVGNVGEENKWITLYAYMAQ